MRKLFKSLALVVVIVVSFVVGYLAVIIILGTVTDYKAGEISELKVENGASQTFPDDSVFTFLSWNIGFGGLGAEMDFFYDGGKKVRPTHEQVVKFTNGILDFLKSADSVDFIILQEVDKNSARTDYQDEAAMIKSALPDYSSSFGINYKVRFIPIPLTKPLGKVEMGQMNLSKYKPVLSQRYSYSSNYKWPKYLFMLDRCFVVSRFQFENGKELILLNTHNSAYDKGGKLRNVEMPVIRDLMLNEFDKGNFVIAGGDWNQNPPSYDTTRIESNYNPVNQETLDDSLFPPDWKIIFDPQHPTNRGIKTPLTTGKTDVTIIDYFIVSPNIHVENVQARLQDFRFSDHNPVFLKVKLD